VSYFAAPAIFTHKIILCVKTVDITKQKSIVSLKRHDILILTKPHANFHISLRFTSLRFTAKFRYT
jgi:hypothetical protein